MSTWKKGYRLKRIEKGEEPEPTYKINTKFMHTKGDSNQVKQGRLCQGPQKT